jgi:hypothetical protein
MINVSATVGEVIGRAEYANGAPPSYLIRFVDNQGIGREDWWSEDALVAPLTKKE